MTKWQRFKSIFGGVCTILLSLLLILYPEYGLITIVLLIGAAAVISGVRKLVYYVTMARFMVGGKGLLYQGVIMLDFGLFTIGFAEVPARYIMLYLLVGYLFGGLVGILRAMDFRRQGLARWRLRLITAAGHFVLAAVCLFLLDSNGAVVYLYCFGMIFGALGRIAAAMRRSAVVYVQQA